MRTGYEDTEFELGETMYETFNEALTECVRACGGSKTVGMALWGHSKGMEAARSALQACLNPERPEKLSLEEVLLILRMARDRGCHVGMEFLCARLSYAPPQPIKPADEQDALERRLIKAAENMQRISDQLFEVAQRNHAPAKLRGVQ